MIDLRQTKEWAQWLSLTGWKIETIRMTNGKRAAAFIRPLPLLPIAFLKLQRISDLIDWNDLNRVKQKHHVWWSVIEPSSPGVVKDIENHGYKLTRDPYLPTKTRVIDLTKSEDQLVLEMSENFRRIIKKLKSSKKQLKIKEIASEEFYEGWKRWAKSYILTKNQFDHLRNSFKGRVEFLATHEGGETLSAIMLLYTPDTCFYYQTWTSDQGRKSSEHVWLTWETIKRAKRLKKNYYNFEGIQDKRFPLAKWDGFTEFKRRFGGYELEYPGSFLKWF